MVVVFLVGCSTDPEQQIVGKWGGDSSAMSVGIKAAKLKSDNPDISPEKAREVARAMSSFGLILNADKTCQLLAGGNKLNGTYTFDKAENLVEMEFETAEIAPENAAQNPKPFEPVKWIGMYNPDEGKMELSAGDRDTYAMIKEMKKTQKLPGLMVLRKK